MSTAVVLKPRGRPSAYSAEIADMICSRISLGESLKSVCRDPDMPGEANVIRWLTQNEPFRAQYVCAREAQCERWADEIVEMADSVLPRNGRPADHAEVQAMRLAIDARRWMLSKLLPKKYGDRLGLENSGSVVLKVVTGLGDE